MNGVRKLDEREPYRPPTLERRGNLREITLTSFTPPPPTGDRNR